VEIRDFGVTEASMTDHSELIERLQMSQRLADSNTRFGVMPSRTYAQAATAIRDLIAERDAAHAKGWSEAIEELESADGFGEWRGAAEYLRAMRKDTPQ